MWVVSLEGNYPTIVAHNPRIRADDPLLDFDNVIITPRVAAQPRFNGLADLEELVVALARAVAR